MTYSTFFRKNKVRFLKGDWTSQICSCPAQTPEILANHQSDQSKDFKAPDGAELLWSARPRPEYSAEVCAWLKLVLCP